MYTFKEAHTLFSGNRLNGALGKIYGTSRVDEQKQRYKKTLNGFIETFGEKENFYLFSAPGRTEIGGNHTDHNHGCVLAASVDLDIAAVVVPNGTNLIRVKSEGYETDAVDYTETNKQNYEENTSAALIRGIASRFQMLGYKAGGFDAYTTSDVLKGSGLSSSAAFEVLICTILNYIYNGGRISPVEIARISQYAENIYFGKPCGLMDQMACAVGGITSIDFIDDQNPKVEAVDFDFEGAQHVICIVDTGGDHADLTAEYAAIPDEMGSIAKVLGGKYMRDISIDSLLGNLISLRKECGDRACLRAIHFLTENERVLKQVNALKAGDFGTFKKLVIESGLSSYKYLQNIYAGRTPEKQGLALALCLAEMFLRGKGAWRVHGGGFGGTIQCFVPVSEVYAFCEHMEKVFGRKSCHVLSVRQFGGVQVTG